MVMPGDVVRVDPSGYLMSIMHIRVRQNRGMCAFLCYSDNSGFYIPVKYIKIENGLLSCDRREIVD